MTAWEYLRLVRHLHFVLLAIIKDVFMTQELPASLDMMEWQLKRKEQLLELLLHEDAKEYMSKDVRNVLSNKQFWKAMDDVVKLIKPISRGTDLMQSEESISFVYYTFSEWEKEFTKKGPVNILEDDDDREIALAAVAERWNLISDFVHAGSFMIDPRFRNYDMEIAQINDGESFLKSKFIFLIVETRIEADAAGAKEWEDGLNDLFDQYRSGEGTFGGPRWNLELTDNPIRPWKTMLRDPKYRALAELAIETLTIPTGIAGVERSVSTLRRVHTWERNRLAPARVDKLVFIHHNLRLLPNEEP